ncbi:tRNA(Glu)-specific nuclease WapA precursor [mine drainage metagenome]|uniref:tRNA(Glu)-specific nuclease WapA n=1 Tax=mine drainage metagenome TaxID=410659 RepID=A0A1J5R210_9ZZZZ
MTGELESVDYSDTPSTNPDVSYTYTRTGQMDTVTDSTGSRSFAYDPNHLVLTSETLDSSFYGGRVLTQKYDSASGTAGRNTGYTLSSGSTTEQDIGYGYDSYGRFSSLSTLSPTLSSSSASFTYSYASGSNLIYTVADSDSGWTQTRTWNATRNLLDSIETIVNTTAKSQFAYAYDAWGRRTSVVRTGEMYSRYENGGLVTTWGYDDRSEVTSAQSYYSTSITNLNSPVEGRNYGYTFDSIGNRVSSSIDSRTTGYTSNNLNQITSRTTPGSVDVSGFAPSSSTVGVTVQGNAAAPTRAGDYFHAVGTVNNAGTSVDASVTVTSSNPNASVTRKRFVPIGDNSGTPWQYDLDGNLTQDDQWVYTWDAENRLVSMETRADLISPNANVIAAADARRIEFTYDYLGRRVQKLVRSGWDGSTYATVLSTTRYVYDGWNLIAEYSVSSSGSLVLGRSFTWGLDLSGSSTGAGGVGGLLLMQDSSGQFEYGYDGNGNVSCVVNRAAGATVAEYEYSPFGEPLRATGVYAQLNPFRFSTKYVDDETGLLYYGHRYYSTSIGRFINRDPSEEQGHWCPKQV